MHNLYEIPDEGAGIGESIRMNRLARGWSQRDLSERSKISRTTIWKIETNNSSPSYDVVRALYNAMGLVLDTLRERKG